MSALPSSSSDAYRTQYAFRAQKSLGIVNGHPDYTALDPLDTEAISGARVYRYDPSGSKFAYIVGSTIHVKSCKSARKPLQIPFASTSPPQDIHFSPRGSYLFTWERLQRVEDGQKGHKNLRVFWLGNMQDEQGDGEIKEVGGFVQKSVGGWQPDVTETESHLLRLSGPSELSIFELHPPSTLSSDETSLSEQFGLHQPAAKLRLDGPPLRSLTLSPSPSVAGQPGVEGKEGIAIWVGEYQGQPGYLSLYRLWELLDAGKKGTALPQTLARKNFFKGDKVQVKWNRLGTMVLFMTQSDVDNTGKSYYGETNFYLLSLNAMVESKISLDKEGPIYDFTWNPNGREFAVAYGFMPARMALFDGKANLIHSFGPTPRNFLSYQPQGRLLLTGGFGNLTGQIDIWDLRSRKKVVEFQAPNSTTCEWSPCGKFILTGTLSPRLRVDNGVKIWWYNGTLLHAQAIEELYQVSWRPASLDSVPAFPAELSPAPAPSSSVTSAQSDAPKRVESPKPVGAYRPPGARGTATPSIFRREDEGGSPAPSPSSTPGPNAMNGVGRYKIARHVPGAGPPPGAEVNGHGQQKQGKKKGKKTEGGSGTATPAASVPATPIASETPSVPPVAAQNGVVGGGEDELVQKKIRNLNKKLKAISELKEKKSKGETLEVTQLKKIEGEKTIQQELAELEKQLKAL